MKKTILLLFSVMIAASFAQAQEKMLSLDEIFGPDPKARVRFGGTPGFFDWSANGKYLRQMQNGALVLTDPISGNLAEAFDVKKFVSALTQTPGFSLDEANAIGQNAQQQFNKAETGILINHNKDLFYYDIAAGKVTRLTNTKEEELEADFSPDGKMVSYVKGMNLFVSDIATQKEKQLTFDGSEKILNGYLDWVYEEELYGRGNKRGYWWSPDSSSIAFLRTDENPVPKFILTDETLTDPRVENTDYPQAGDPNPLVKLGIVNVLAAPANPLAIGGIKLPNSVARKLPKQIIPDSAKWADLSKYKPEDLLIARVAWSPDSRAVVFQALNREQTWMDVNASDANGRVKTIFTEKTPAYVEVYDNPTFLNDGTVLWQSARSGFKHLYRIDQNGFVVKQLTSGKWEVRNFYGVDEKNGYAYFSAAGENVWNAEDAYRVKLDGTGLERLTKRAGQHFVNFNKDFTHFIDLWSDVNTPPKVSLFKANGELVRVLNENKVDVLGQYKLGKPEFMTVKTRDGFEMEAMMIKPPDFDPSKKYPVFAYTYSGPHAVTVRNAWGGGRYMWHQMLAQKGYIIWICDNRSASGKGEEQTWKAYKQLGVLEQQDLEDGFSYLKSLPYVDGERLGMWGWSYGGFMTSFFMTRSKTLKMGIAGGLVSDWAYYDSIYTERYMMTPQNNPDGYKKTSVHAQAANLHGKLLIIHGTIDDNVHQQNAIKLIHELQKANKQFEFMTYPTQRHGVSNPAQARHMYEMMTNFIFKNL